MQETFCCTTKEPEGFVECLFSFAALLISVFYIFPLIFEISIAKAFQVPPSLIAISPYEYFVFTSAFLVFVSSFICLFNLIFNKNSKKIGFLLYATTLVILFMYFHKTSLIIFFVHLVFLSSFSVFFDKISIQNKFIALIQSKFKFFITLFGLVLILGYFTSILFFDSYIEHFMEFYIPEDEFITTIDEYGTVRKKILIRYYDGNPIYKEYNLTKENRKFIENFENGYEYNGQKFSKSIDSNGLIKYFRQNSR